jgi:3-oxoacyl-[acyl-carrier-protein] synthase II
MTRRVVITGLGTVNSLSNDIPTFWDYLCAGRSGVSLIEQFDTTAFKVHFGGEVKNFVPENHLEGKVAKRLDRFSQFAMFLKQSNPKPAQQSRFVLNRPGKALF